MKPNQNEQNILGPDSHADLSASEKAELWQGIQARLGPIPQRSWWVTITDTMTKQRHLSKSAQIAIVAVLLLGVSGTAAASNQAKPGDLLFGIDRALEQVQLSLASEEKTPEIRLRHAEERLAEIQEMLAEAEAEMMTAGDATSSNASDGTSEGGEDITETETSDTTTTEDQDTADDDSSDDGRDADEDKWAKRINTGATLVINDLNAIFEGEYDGDTEAAITALIANINEQLGGDLGELEIEVDERDNGRTKVRIKAERHSDDYDGDSDDKDDNSEDYDKDSDDSYDDDYDDKLEVEIEVKNRRAVIEIEVDGVETKETVEETDRDALVAYIADKYGVTVNDIEAVLKFEIDNDSDDDKYHDSDDWDNDDEESKDNSGDATNTSTDNE
jgi:hypothetical protein